MSAIPIHSRAYFRWRDAYGPEGEPTPTPVDPMLVGGRRSGERIDTPPDLGRHLRVPVPARRTYVADVERLPSFESYRVDEYTLRTYLPCWSAAAVRHWVLDGLPDEDAQALRGEWLS